MDKTGFLFDIYRGTTHDGPGMRSTVFMKGCPLHCAWCHNPEGISPMQSIWWNANACIGCMTCKKVCSAQAIIADQTGIAVDEEHCGQCGLCVNACPTKAMAFIGEEWDIEKLVKEVEKDIPYYEQTRGGVTVSGGEALMQAEFVAEFFRILHKHNIHTALDTSGFASLSQLDLVLENTDIVLYDLKLMDPTLHEKYTGVSNELILNNAKHIARRIQNHEIHCDMWIRTPLIPDATAFEENIAGISRFIRDNLNDAVSRWEMCAFNNSCINKYGKLHQEWQFHESPLITRSHVDHLLETAKANNPQLAEAIFVTGIIHEE